MSKPENYIRVLPRDAFNEANLLKCIGKLTLLIEDKFIPGLTFEYDGKPFRVFQNEDDGSIAISNIQFFTAKYQICFMRPLNSRDPWPLYAYVNDHDEYAVFDNEGNLTDEFKRLIRVLQ